MYVRFRKSMSKGDILVRSNKIQQVNGGQWNLRREGYCVDGSLLSGNVNLLNVSNV